MFIHPCFFAAKDIFPECIGCHGKKRNALCIIPAHGPYGPGSGQVMQVLDLSKDQEMTIETPNGGTNHLVVKNGVIWCDDASCPDKLCVKQGKKHLDTDTIVCLPDQMIVTIVEK